MKLYVIVKSERASKGQGGNEYVNIDLYGEKEVMLGRLVFQKDAKADGRYILGEDFFSRSDRLAIQAYKEKAEIPLKEITPPSCDWCKRRATHKDWREIDDMTTSTVECDPCGKLDTAFLLDRQIEQKGKQQKGETGHNYHCRVCKTNVFWTLDDYAESGSPVCVDCGDDMELVRK